MAFFLAPLAELVLEGMAVGTGSHIANDVMNEFAPRIKDASSELLGKKIGGYAHDNPDGFVAQTLNKSYQYSKTPATNTQHAHRHSRRGARRTS
jgi:hypothetical protein